MSLLNDLKGELDDLKKEQSRLINYCKEQCFIFLEYKSKLKNKSVSRNRQKFKSISRVSALAVQAAGTSTRIKWIEKKIKEIEDNE